jgi:hypothetical protein
VADLDQAASHLQALGLTFETRTDELIVVDPRHARGLRYGFTHLIAPGDPRSDTA